MNSCIYEGYVRHRRMQPAAHEFRKKLFLIYLDLAELQEVFRNRWLWSAHRVALVRFRREDHLGDPQLPLEAAVYQLLEDADLAPPGGSVRLLTQLRHFGYVFNPLSMYYCFDGRDDLKSVVAEVGNTPWGERHCYVLQPEPGDSNRFRVETLKEFHVSPFMPMDLQYRWQLTEPDESLTVSLENWRDGQKFFDVTMQLRRRAISSSALARTLIKYPFMSQQVIVSIYWQALRLWLKRCPFYPHPKHAKVAAIQKRCIPND